MNSNIKAFFKKYT